VTARLNQGHNVGVVETEHATLCVLETDGASELIPHKTPETSAVELAAGDGLKTEVALQSDDIGDGLLLDLRKTGFLRGDTLFTDLLAGIEEVLRAELHVGGSASAMSSSES
jgi:hypothetical protein